MKIKRFEFNMFPVNCYVLSDETGEAAVIDAGCYYPEEQQRLKKYIQDNHLSVKLLLNTHLHLDHIFGNAFMVREFGVKPQACKDDEFLLPHTADHCRMFGYPCSRTLAGRNGILLQRLRLHVQRGCIVSGKHRTSRSGWRRLQHIKAQHHRASVRAARRNHRLSGTRRCHQHRQ